MKKKLKQLASAAVALCMCLTWMPMAASAAVWSVPDEVGITVSAAANELADGSYNVTYNASLTVSNDFANAAAHAATANYSDELKNLRFTCTLTDKLVAQMSSVSASDFTFNGGSVYELVDVDKSGESIVIVYKLIGSVVDSWNGEIETAKTAVKKTLTMSSTKAVTESQMETALSAAGYSATATGNTIPISADVEITRNDGGVIPVMGVSSIDAASGSGSVYITAYSSGSGSSGGGSSTPTYNVKVENPDTKGEVTPESPKAEAGSEVVIEVEAEDGYRMTGITVTDAKGNEIEVTRNADGTYSFEMPKGEVTVVPVFGLSAARPEESGVGDRLDADNHIAFMVGDDKGNFRPNANITRAEVAQIFYALLKDKNVPITHSFTDVDPDAWYATAVHTMASLGAVKGVGNGQFAPERPITRAEFATIASNFAKAARDQFDFVDVDETHWAYPYISASSFYGWVAGVGGNKFEPDRPIMRAEAATIVNNMLGRIGDEAKIDAGHGRQFPDVDESHWGWYEIGEATDSHDHSFDGEFIEETWHD